MKISDISKAFNLNSKDVLAIFKDIDPEKKASGAAVSDEEFEIFFSVITKARQIKDMEAYTSGKVTITQVREKKAGPVEEKPAAPVVEAKKSAPEVKVEEKKPEAAPEKAENKKPQPEAQRNNAQGKDRQFDRRDG